MAHKLETDSSMFFVGEMPWHGLGVALPANATWAEVVERVGFYAVQEREVYVAGNPDPIRGQKALVRGDDGRFLAIVGENYGVVDFADMAEAVMTAAGREAVFSTGGLLGRNGERGWLMGELGAPIRVKGDRSEIRRYFTVTSAHTGNSSVHVLNNATRIVCANTLGAALGERGGYHASIRHTKNAAERVRDAAVAFRNLNAGFEKFGQLANLMAETRFTTRQMQQTVDAIFPTPEAAKASSRLVEKREKLMSLWAGEAAGMEGIKGTAWGALQAWTEFADHHTTVRALPDRTASSARLESIWFGGGAELKQKALAAIQSAAA